MSEVHGSADEDDAAPGAAPPSAPGTAPDDAASEEVPAWEATTIRLSTLLAIWFGY